MSTEITFNFANEELSVQSVGPMWVSPCNGQQHTSLDGAVRAECVRLVRDSGGDPEDTDCVVDIAVACCQAEDNLVSYPQYDPLRVLGHLVTEVVVHWDASDSENEGWAYRIVGEHHTICTGGIDFAQDLDGAIDSIINTLDLPCRTDDWAREPNQEGGWACWTPTVG